MSKVRNAVVNVLDEIGIAHQDGPENSRVFLLNNVNSDDSISFFISFIPDDDDFVTMGIHIYECGQEEFTIAMAIAGNINATSKVAKVFPLHIPVADKEQGKQESTGAESNGEEEIRAHVFVTSQFFWTEEKMKGSLMTRNINAALAAREDFLQQIHEYKNPEAN